MKKKILLFSLAGLTVALVLIVMFALEEHKQVEALKEDLEEVEDFKKRSQEQKEALQMRILADEMFISGRYDSAMMLYENLIQSAEEKSLLINRRNAMGKTDSLRLTFMSKEQERRAQIQAMEQSLQDEIFRADSIFNYKTDSLKHRLLEEIADLKQRLSVKDAELEKVPKYEKLVFYSKNGNKTTYYGEVKNGKANGSGMGYYPSGNMYIGKWKDNLKHGQNGHFRWLSGERYEGDYVSDKREGSGTYFWANGEKYEGEWKDDKRSGVGTLYDGDNNVKLKGNWKDGELVSASE